MVYYTSSLKWNHGVTIQYSPSTNKKYDSEIKDTKQTKKKSVWKGGYKSGIKYSIIKWPFLDLLYVVRLIVKLTK